MNTKYLFKSKTIIFNLIVSVAAVAAYFYPPATALVQENAVLIMAIVGAGNMILRRLTKNAYAFFAVVLVMLSLPSCVTPPTYTVNTVPYAEAIKTNPKSVVMDKKDVTPIGGFQGLDINGRVVTDYGTINSSPDGITVDTVVDLRSGK